MKSGRKENQQERDTGILPGLMEMFYTLFKRDLPGSIPFLAGHLRSLFSKSLNVSRLCYLLWPIKLDSYCATSEPMLQEALLVSFSQNCAAVISTNLD